MAGRLSRRSAEPELHTSTATTATTAEINRSISSSPRPSFIVASSSAHGSFSSSIAKSNRLLRHQLSLTDLRFLHRLGSGDIGSVYLAELKCYPSSSDDLPPLAAKVMELDPCPQQSAKSNQRTI